MRIQHNIMAMNSYRNYNNNTSALSSNLEKLSSGYKINRAGDDAAGLAISEKMRAQISGLEQAQSNVDDGISLVKTGEGAMQEIQDMLNRMTTLATQSANGTYDDTTDREQLQKEVDNLKSEINRIADSSNFNGINLLDGSLSGKSQVSNLTMGSSTATKGEYTISTAFADFAFTSANLTSADIDQDINYTVTWKDGSGTEKTSTVTLTFKGQGDDTVADLGDTATAGKNYFVDASNTKYYLGTDGKLTKENVEKAIKAGLQGDAALADAFDISIDSDILTLKAKVDGSSGAQLISTGVTNTFKTDPKSVTIGGTGFRTVKTQALDSMQKFSVTELNAAKTGADATTIENDIFEVDGHRFLCTNGFTASDIEALDDDITTIEVGAANPAAAKADVIGAEIARVTGLDVKGYTSNKTDGSKINAGDVVFGDKLNLTGQELTLQIGDTSDSYNQMGVVIDDMHTSALGIDDLDISDQEGAAAAIDKIKAAINKVSSTRGTLGATQNRLEHTSNNLSVMTENIQDAESTIRDTDIAEEMMSYTKNNILVQSAQAMLAQANSVPQGVLQLLQ